MVYTVDDGDHTVRKFTPEGKQVMLIGTSGKASDTGYDGKTHGSVKRGGPPFNRPTDVAVAPNGEIYVCRRLRQRPGAPLHRRRDADPVLGRAGDGTRPVPPAARHRDLARRPRLRDRPGERPDPDLLPGRQAPRDVDPRPAAHGHLLRQGGPGVRLGALVASGPGVVHQRQDQVRPARRRAGPGPGGEPASALVQRRPGGPGKLRRPAHALRRFARGSLRGRGHLDLRCIEGGVREDAHTFQKFARCPIEV